MSVPEQIPHVGYIANGQSTEFPITFDLHDPNYLVVTVNKEIPEVGTYSIDMNTLKVVFNTSPNEGDQVELYRETTLNRDTNYQKYDNSFRPDAVNWDFDKIIHILQEQHMIDAELASRLKQEIEWRRTHDANFDELAKMRDAQVFSGLKGYIDTIFSTTNPNIFDGVTAGIVFALDKKSVQTHLENIYEQLAAGSSSVVSEKERAEAAEDALNASIQIEKERALLSEAALQGQINANGVGNRAYKQWSDMDADKVNIPIKSKVTVTNDPNPAVNGDYQWDGVVFTKSAFDPLTQSKDYTNTYVSQKLPIIKALYSPANNVVDKYVHLPDGGIASSAGTALNIFPVEAGKTYAVKSSKISSSAFAIALRATNNSDAGTTLGLVTLNATTDPNVKTFSLSSGSTAKFAFASMKLPSLNFDITNDFLVNEGIKPVEYDQINTIGGVTIVDENARARMLEKSSLIMISELYNPSSNVADKYVVIPGGSVSTATGTMLSVFPVEAGKTYAVRSGQVNNSAFAVALRSSNTTANGTTLGLATLEVTGDPKLKTFTVPVGSAALFALINIKIPSVGLDVESDLSVSLTFPNGASEVSGINQMPLADTEARERIAKLENDIITGNSKLTGKTWAAIGDSITEHNFRSNLNYHDYIKEEVGGMTVYNYGISGSGFWNRANTIAGQVSQNPDYLTMFWGANDLIRAPKNLGNRDSTGTDSLGGLMNIALSSLINKFYNKKLAVFTLLPRDIYNNVTNATAVDESGVSQGYTATQVADLTIAICEKYSIPVLDLYRESNLYPWIAAANDYYFKAPTLPSPDGLHPNDNGQKLIAHKIREFMESL